MSGIQGAAAEVPDEVGEAVRRSLDLWDSGQRDEAEALAAATCEKFPYTARAAHLYSCIAGWREDWPVAALRWARVREITTDDSASYWQGAMALRQSGDLAAADALTERAMIRFSDVVEVWVERGEVLMAKQDWSAACDCWRDAREHFPKVEAPYVLGAKALAEAARFDEADEVAKKAVEIFPASRWVAHCYAELPVWRRDWAHAIARWAAVREVFEDDATGYSRGCEVLMADGQVAAAKALAIKGAAQFPGHPAFGEWAKPVEDASVGGNPPTPRWAGLTRMWNRNRPNAT